jgi:hypothetical protein
MAKQKKVSVNQTVKGQIVKKFVTKKISESQTETEELKKKLNILLNAKIEQLHSLLNVKT